MKEFLKVHQQKTALILGYTLIFLLAFGLGRISISLPNPPEIKFEEPPTLPDNNSAKVQGLQSNSPMQAATGANDSKNGDCGGKIKGNISSSSKIYHMPGGAFYERTQAEACFNTEAEAQAAGFRKSKL